eukprot:747475-Hanusia_phi.AAC.1
MAGVAGDEVRSGSELLSLFVLTIATYLATGILASECCWGVFADTEREMKHGILIRDSNDWGGKEDEENALMKKGLGLRFFAIISTLSGRSSQVPGKVKKVYTPPWNKKKKGQDTSKSNDTDENILLNTPMSKSNENSDEPTNEKYAGIVISLSTQFGQVSSPAKPEFSPTVSHRRRVCAIIEGLAEKQAISFAAVQAIQTINAMLEQSDFVEAEKLKTSLSDRAKHMFFPKLVSPYKEFSRKNGVCMEGSRIFVCEVQQLLHSMKDSPFVKDQQLITTQIENLKNSLESLPDRPMALAASVSQGSDELHWRREYLDLEHKFHSLAGEYDNLKLESSRLVKTNEDLEHELVNQKKAKDQLGKEIEIMAQEKATIELQVSRLVSNMEHLRREALDVDARFNEMSLQATRYEQDTSSLLEEKNSLLVRVERLEQEKKALEQAAAFLMSPSHQAKKMQNDRHVEALKKQNDEFAGSVNELKNKLTQMTIERQTFRGEIQTLVGYLTSDLKTCLESVRRLQEDSSADTKMYQKQNRKLSELETYSNYYQQSLDNLQQLLAEFYTEKSNISSKLESSKEQLED